MEMVERRDTSSLKMNNNPQFFKFFLPTITDHRLRIPWKFLKHMEGEYFGTVSLRGPNMNIWHVELVENPDGVFLQNGWHDFVRDHSVQVGYCLVFRYVGNLHFTVQIFDTSACNKEYDCSIRPSNDSTGFGDYNNMRHGDNLAKVFYGSSYKACRGSFKNPMGENNHPALWRPPKTQLAFREPLWKKPHGTTQISLEKMVLKVQPRRSLENKAEKKHRSRKALIKHGSNDFLSERRHVEKEEIARALETARSFKSNNHFAIVVMRMSNISMNFVVSLPLAFARLALPVVTETIILYGPNMKAWRTRYHYSGYYARFSAGWRSFAVDNNLEEYDVCVFEAITKNTLKVHIFRVVDEIIPLISQPQKDLAALKVQPSQRAVVEYHKYAIASQRRPVETEEIARALQKARSFKSENQFIAMVMRRTYVYIGFCLDFPRAFVHSALPKVTQTMSLYGPNRMEAWETKYIYKECRGMLSAGWHSFAVSNNLEMDDVCVFEVITHNELRVHIFRVVDEITPLIGCCLKSSNCS